MTSSLRVSAVKRHGGAQQGCAGEWSVAPRVSAALPHGISMLRHAGEFGDAERVSAAMRHGGACGDMILVIIG